MKHQMTKQHMEMAAVAREKVLAEDSEFHRFKKERVKRDSGARKHEPKGAD